MRRFLAALALASVVASPACAHGGAVGWGADIVEQEGAWYATPSARAIADGVVRHQAPDGGWPKNTDLAAAPAQGSAQPSTFDNNATTLPMEFLAHVISAGRSGYRSSFERGLDYILAAQYANGGWPQYYPLRGGYYDQITFNDDAMVRVLALLREVAAGRPPYAFVDAARRERAAHAVERGTELILRAQVRQNGVLTAWCAQHDRETLAPAWARAYEPPSLSGQETVDIVRFLMQIESPSPEVVAAVEGAAAWLQSVAIAGTRVEDFRAADGQRDRRIVHDANAPRMWARFYELETNRPIFLGRDSTIRYSFAEIEPERRAGYNYYGVWAERLLGVQYPAWRARHTAR